MQIGLSRVPWDEDSSVKDNLSVWNPCQGTVYVRPRTQKQDTVLSLVVKWLKPGIIPPRGDVKGGGRTGHSGEGRFGV